MKFKTLPIYSKISLVLAEAITIIFPFQLFFQFHVIIPPKDNPTIIGFEKLFVSRIAHFNSQEELSNP
jgi:hypothetical protein